MGIADTVGTISQSQQMTQVTDVVECRECKVYFVPEIIDNHYENLCKECKEKNDNN
jgi:hypothetical protein